MAAQNAGHTLQVPFSPGRTDASQDQTDADSFAVLESKADGFRNYLAKDQADWDYVDQRSVNRLQLSLRSDADAAGGQLAVVLRFDGKHLLDMEPHERAAAGLFLGFQYPVEIPGVSNLQFLREALNSQRKARGEEPLTGGEFLKLAKDKVLYKKKEGVPEGLYV